MQKIIMSLVDMLHMLCSHELSLHYRLNYLELVIQLCNEHDVSKYDEEIEDINNSCERLIEEENRKSY